MLEQVQPRGWFATISYDDPLLEKYALDENCRCRLFRSPQLPAFEVRAGGDFVCLLDPRDVLFAFGNDRIAFLWDSDKVGFAEDLSSLLKERETLVGGIRKIAKIGVGIAVAGVVLGSVLAVKTLLPNLLESR